MFSRITSVPSSVAAFAARFTTNPNRTMPNINKRVPGVDTFYPLNEPVIGTPYSAVCCMSDLDCRPPERMLDV